MASMVEARLPVIPSGPKTSLIPLPPSRLLALPAAMSVSADGKKADKPGKSKTKGVPKA